VTAKAPKALSISIAFLLVAIFSAAQDAKPKTFSADFGLTSPKNEKLMTGRYYFAPPHVRIDMHDVQHNVSAIAIIDYEKNVILAILPQWHSYTEEPFDLKSQGPDGSMAGPDFVAANPCAGHPNWKCKKTGIDTLEGRKCDVWEIMTNDPDADGTEWIDQELSFPIKYRRADGMSIEYTNIQAGQQPSPSLFQVPPGFLKEAPKASRKLQPK
jgi:hypothetical protein